MHGSAERKCLSRISTSSGASSPSRNFPSLQRYFYSLAVGCESLTYGRSEYRRFGVLLSIPLEWNGSFVVTHHSSRLLFRLSLWALRVELFVWSREGPRNRCAVS